jgi:Tetracyclin repressor-like, C-terminal domain
VIHALQEVYDHGVYLGVIRLHLDPLDLRMTISSSSFFNVLNQRTLPLIFKHLLEIKVNYEAKRDNIIETMVRYVRM